MKTILPNDLIFGNMSIIENFIETNPSRSSHIILAVETTSHTFNAIRHSLHYITFEISYNFGNNWDSRIVNIFLFEFI